MIFVQMIHNYFFFWIWIFGSSASEFGRFTGMFLLSLDDLAYEVRWFFTRLRGGETTIQVASIDRFGVVRKEARNSSSDISVERKDTNTYVLSIHGTQDRWVLGTSCSYSLVLAGKTKNVYHKFFLNYIVIWFFFMHIFVHEQTSFQMI